MPSSLAEMKLLSRGSYCPHLHWNHFQHTESQNINPTNNSSASEALLKVQLTCSVNSAEEKTKFQFENLKSRHHLWDLDVDGRRIDLIKSVISKPFSAVPSDQRHCTVFQHF
jgi:hypothetical protein